MLVIGIALQAFECDGCGTAIAREAAFVRLEGEEEGDCRGDQVCLDCGIAVAHGKADARIAVRLVPQPELPPAGDAA